MRGTFHLTKVVAVVGLTPLYISHGRERNPRKSIGGRDGKLIHKPELGSAHSTPGARCHCRCMVGTGSAGHTGERVSSLPRSKRRPVIAMAVAANADFVVTTDRDLYDDPGLVARSRDEWSIRVALPVEFLAALS